MPRGPYSVMFSTRRTLPPVSAPGTDPAAPAEAAAADIDVDVDGEGEEEGEEEEGRWRQSKHCSDVPPTIGIVPASANFNDSGAIPNLEGEAGNHQNKMDATIIIDTSEHVLNVSI